MTASLAGQESLKNSPGQLWSVPISFTRLAAFYEGRICGNVQEWLATNTAEFYATLRPIWPRTRRQEELTCATTDAFSF